MVAKMVGQVHAQLEALDADGREDEDVVFGVMQALLAKLPRSVVVKKYAENLRTEGFCLVDALEMMTVDDVRQAGVPGGHAKLVHSALVMGARVSTDRSGEVARVIGVAPGATKKASEFPELKKNGLPSAAALRAWMPSVYAAVRGNGGDVSDLKAALAKPADPVRDDYDHGGDADRILFEVLTGCGGKGVPPQIFSSFGKAVQDGEQGLAAFKQLFQSVLTVTDDSLGVLQRYVNDPGEVTTYAKLAPESIKWRNAVEELDAGGCPVWPEMQRISLRQLCSKLPLVKGMFLALDAKHMGQNVPVEDMLRAVQQAINSTQSVEEQSAVLGFAASEDAPRVPKAPFKPKDKSKAPRCRFHDRGTCRYPEERCNWRHVGEAGNGFREPGTGAHQTSELAQLTAAISELVKAQSAGREDSKAARWPNSMLNRKLDGYAVIVENENINDIQQPETLSSQGFEAPETPSGGGVSSPLEPETQAQGFNPPEAPSGGVVSQPLELAEALESQGFNPSETPLAVVDQRRGGVSSLGPDSDASTSVRHAVYSRGVGVCEDSEGSSLGDTVNTHNLGYTVVIKEPGLSPECELDGEESNRVRDDNSVVILSLACDSNLGDTVCFTTSDMPSVVVDTAATRHVIGRGTLSFAVNVRPLSSLVTLYTANGTVDVDKQGDLPGAGGLMQDALIVPCCAKSLFAAVTSCRVNNMSMIVDDSATGARFTRKGKLVRELNCDGRIITFDLDCNPEHACIAAGESRYAVVSGDNVVLLESDLASHNMIMGSSDTQDLRALDSTHCTCMLSEEDLAPHYLDGHRPFKADCPWCAQAGMRHRRAVRIAHKDRLDKSGFSISVDYTGPHEADVDGYRSALVGVEVASSVGYVGLQKTQTAAEGLESLKQFESQLKSKSGDPNKNITEFHHDDDQSFRGCIADYARDRGWKDTHTGGYNPNNNSVCERRIGMLNQLFRVLLLCATGGGVYYEQLWGRGLVYANMIINSMPWPDREAPDSFLADKDVSVRKNRHVFGAYCLYYIDKEQKSGKWQPNAEMGVWVGCSADARGGHLVCPIQWDSDSKVWLIGKTVNAMTVKVYDNKFPLRMDPGTATDPTSFHEFVDKVFNPLLVAPLKAAVPKPAAVPKLVTALDSAPDTSSHGSDGEAYEVEYIKKSRVKNGKTQYLVKWLGWNNRYNVWKDEDELDCDDLIEDYKSESAHASIEIERKCLQTEEEVNRQSGVLFGENDCHAITAVSRLMARQKLSGSVHGYLPGYKKEICNILRRRLILQDEGKYEEIGNAHQIGQLRMLLELKRPGRKKARLVLQGFREPLEWDNGSNMSPVAFIDTIRMLILMNGPATDVISTNDVSVAFLQAHGFDESDKRFVSYKMYKESAEMIFQLCGPLYGQRVASKQWYYTIATWLCDRGFIQAKNEPCLFNHPDTGFKIVLVVDDLLCRGSPECTQQFHDELEGPDGFECGENSRQLLTPDNSIDYCGLNISVAVEDGHSYYSIDQIESIVEMLDQLDLIDQPVRSSPIPSDDLLLSDSTPLSAEESAWAKSALGQLHYFARGTRWDIAYAVSRISQFCSQPTVGVKLALKYLAGYLIGTVQYRITVMRSSSPDVFHFYTDSSHYGKGRSQTGVFILLNGAPLHWRSNRQPLTADSPAVSEIYALKEGVKDGKLIQWVAEEMGIKVEYPFVVQVDNSQARSFQGDTCPNSKIRGSIDMREAWIEEMRHNSVVRTEHVPGGENLADILTKCFKGPKFSQIFERIVNFQKAEILGGHVYLVDLIR